MQNLLLIFNLVAPVFLIVALGYFLKRIKVIDDNFVSLSSKIVFKVSLPALIFIHISKIHLSHLIDWKLIVVSYAGTFLVFILAWLFSIPLIKSPKDKASFIQGSFRSNFAVIGLALIESIYGPEELGRASLLLAFMIPIYNVLSVIALTVPMRKENNLNLGKTILEIIKNPLIIAVLAALPFSYFGIRILPVFTKTVDYLAALSLPLALLGIGGF